MRTSSSKLPLWLTLSCLLFGSAQQLCAEVGLDCLAAVEREAAVEAAPADDAPSCHDAAASSEASEAAPLPSPAPAPAQMECCATSDAVFASTPEKAASKPSSAARSVTSTTLREVGRVQAVPRSPAPPPDLLEEHCVLRR